MLPYARLGLPYVFAPPLAGVQFSHEFPANFAARRYNKPVKRTLRVRAGFAVVAPSTHSAIPAVCAFHRTAYLGRYASIRNSHSKTMIAGGSMLTTRAPSTGARRRAQLSHPSRQSPSSPMPGHLATSSGKYGNTDLCSGSQDIQASAHGKREDA